MQHCPGIGPARLEKLREAGILSWTDVLEHAERIPNSHRKALEEERGRCLVALEAANIRYFVDHFMPHDRWRILSHFLEQASYFDIETAGLENGAPITVIVCWHRGELFSFVEHENLDEFLDLLDDMTLLVSFNGSSFDVPRILDAFHIPDLPCPHLDLRWSCYHRGFRGGLKDIAERMSITRPEDLQNADGAEAIQLWNAWMLSQDQDARQRLLRYCAADVLLLVMIAHQIVEREDIDGPDCWSQLAQRFVVPASAPARLTAETRVSLFGATSPERLRRKLQITKRLRRKSQITKGK